MSLKQTRHLQWAVQMHPRAQKRHRHTKSGRTYDPSAAEKAQFRKKSLAACPPLTEVDKSAMRMRLVFACPRPQSHYTTKKRDKLSSRAPVQHVFKCDIDNYAKFVMDSLCGTFYHDDAQIFELTARKEWVSSGSEAVSVELTSYSDNS